MRTRKPLPPIPKSTTKTKRTITKGDDPISYKAPDTGDPELDRKLRKEDYDTLLHWLLEVQTGHAFACWLDKLALIDGEAITAYVRDHWGELDGERRAWARLRLDGVRDLPMDGKEDE